MYSSPEIVYRTGTPERTSRRNLGADSDEHYEDMGEPGEVSSDNITQQPQQPAASLGAPPLPPRWRIYLDVRDDDDDHDDDNNDTRL